MISQSFLNNKVVFFMERVYKFTYNNSNQKFGYLTKFKHCRICYFRAAIDN